MAAAVRQALHTTKQSHRTIDERLALRFPRVLALQARLLSRLPPTSRVRRAAVARTGWLGLQAYNRRDLEAVVVGFHPEFEYRPARDWVDAGLVEASYRGLENYRRYVATADEVWRGENYLTPREVIDLGDRVLLLADGEMRGQVSRVPLNQEFALLCTLKEGRPISAQEYYDHDEALSVVGLS